MSEAKIKNLEYVTQMARELSKIAGDNGDKVLEAFLRSAYIEGKRNISEKYLIEDWFKPRK